MYSKSHSLGARRYYADPSYTIPEPVVNHPPHLALYNFDDPRFDSAVDISWQVYQHFDWFWPRRFLTSIMSAHASILHRNKDFSLFRIVINNTKSWKYILCYRQTWILLTHSNMEFLFRYKDKFIWKIISMNVITSEGNFTSIPT